jgi:hypothetical protein
VCLRSSIDCMRPADKSKSAPKKKKKSQTSASVGAYEEERLKRQSGGIPGCRRQRTASPSPVQPELCHKTRKICRKKPTK